MTVLKWKITNPVKIMELLVDYSVEDSQTEWSIIKNHAGKYALCYAPSTPMFFQELLTMLPILVKVEPEDTEWEFTVVTSEGTLDYKVTHDGATLVRCGNNIITTEWKFDAGKTVTELYGLLTEWHNSSYDDMFMDIQGSSFSNEMKEQLSEFITYMINGKRQHFNTVMDALQLEPHSNGLRLTEPSMNVDMLLKVLELFKSVDKEPTCWIVDWVEDKQQRRSVISSEETVTYRNVVAVNTDNQL